MQWLKRDFPGKGSWANHVTGTEGTCQVFFNPLHPKISMHILYTVLSAFPKVLER